MSANWRKDAESILMDVVQTSAVRPYSMQEFGRIRYTDAVSVILPPEDVIQVLHQVRRVLPDTLIAFVGTTKWYGDEKHDGHELVVAPGDSQFDIVAIADVYPANFDMRAGDVIKRLQHYDDWCGIDIIQAETDTVQMQLLTIPDDVMAFAEDVYEFCPDIVDQGVGSIEKLAEIIETDQFLYLWWD